MNTDKLERALYEAERRVLKIQTKLHTIGLVIILIAGSTTCSCATRRYLTVRR
ncbi:hypothetical protein ACWGI9_45345 [Streptomyces sp. NPDC054833]